MFDNDYVSPATAAKIVPSGFSPRQERPFMDMTLEKNTVEIIAVIQHRKTEIICLGRIHQIRKQAKKKLVFDQHFCINN